MAAEERDTTPVEEPEEHSSSVGNLMGSRISHLDDILLEKLEAVFNEQTSEVRTHDLAKIASEHDPVDLAFAASSLPHHARYVLYDNLPSLEAQIRFMINTDDASRYAVFRHLPDAAVRVLLERMPPDEAVDMLESFSPRRLVRVFELLDPKVAQQIYKLQRHGEQTAGRLMTNELFAFPMHATIGQVAACIRENPGVELTRWIFVVKENRELIGFVPSRNLIINSLRLPLKQVMQPVQHTVTVDATREEVIDLVERYKIPALPVINNQGQLEGVITYEDVVEAMEDVADQTLARIAGTSEEIGENEPTYRRMLSRAPWLMVSTCSGLIAATSLLHFEGAPWYIFVPAFVPLVTGMSGAVAIQCSTVLVRSMATGELSEGTKGDAIAREALLGAALGLFFGFGCGMVVYVMNMLGLHEVGNSPVVAGLIVSSGVFAAVLTSTTLGVSSPFLFARLGIDPAVAAGPIVTALNDVLSMLMYCAVAYTLTSILFF